MNSETNTRVLWIAAAGAVLAWPFGVFVGLVLATGQDGPGSALAHGFGGLVTMALWAISTAIVLWNLRKVAKHLGGPARTIVALSIAFLPVVALVSAINHQTYDLRVWNETDKMIDDVSVHMAGKSHSFGVMSSGVTATRAFQPDRPASSAEIRWTGEDGRAHVVEVDLSDVVPRRYDRGVLTFTIYAEESVRAGFFIRKDYAF